MQCQATTNSGSQCKNDAKEGSPFCHIPSHQGQDPPDPTQKPLTEKEERFCQLYVSREFYGNGTQAFMEAYGYDDEDQYNTAKVNASKKLTKTNICHRINELLEEAGLNDNHVDKQLLFMVNQHADFAQKMAAIREYNKLRARITDKVDVTSGGEPIGKIEVEIVQPEDATD